MKNSNIINSSLSKLLIYILVLAGTFSVAYSQIPPVKQVKAELQGKKIDGQYVASGYIAWYYSEDNYDVDSYNIYVLDGKAGDNSKFELLMNVKSDSSNLGKDNYLAKLDNLKGTQGGWSFFVTAVKGNDESSKSPIIYVPIQNSQPHDKAYITSKPSLNSKINVEYIYKPKFESNIDNPKSVWKLDHAPDGAVIDSQTGEISWTPNKVGYFTFVIELKIVDGDKELARTSQQWSVKVAECGIAATIYGTIKDEDGNPIKYGTIEFFTNNNDDGKIEKGKYDIIKFQNGEFHVLGLEKGQYYIAVQAFANSNTIKYYTTWYENTIKFSEAKSLNVDCGDTIQLSFIIKEIPQPKFFKVRGKVVDADTELSIKNSVVQFIGKNISSDRAEIFTFTTNSNGVFEGKLPDTFEYIAMATSKIIKKDNNSTISYFPQYYDLADDLQDAKLIKLIADLTGIDFYLKTVPDYSNSISGTVVNGKDDPVTPTEVIAYLVDTETKNRKYVYFGKSVKTDEFGSYLIENLIPGQYVIFAKPYDKMSSPGFYNVDGASTLSWEDATRVTVAEEGNSGDYKIILNNIEKVHGKGIVKGGVGKHKGIIEPAGEPNVTENGINGANVYLINSNNNVIQNLITDEFGRFELVNLADGNYQLVVDKVGYSSFRTDVNIGEESIVEKEIEMSPVSPTSVSNLIDPNIEVYPNPATDMIRVTLGSNLQNVSISILSYSGAELSQYNTNNSQQFVEFNTSELSAGAYFVRISNGNSNIIKPVIIVK